MSMKVAREDVNKYQKEQREKQKQKDLEELHRQCYADIEDKNRPDPTGNAQTKVVVIGEGICMIFHNDPNGFCFSTSLLKRVWVIGISFSFLDESLDIVVIPTFTKGEQTMVENVKVDNKNNRTVNGYKSSFNLVGRHDVKKVNGLDSCRTVFNCLFGEDSFKSIDEQLTAFKNLRDTITEQSEALYAEKKVEIEERYKAKEPIGDLVDSKGEPLTEESVNKPDIVIVEN